MYSGPAFSLLRIVESNNNSGPRGSQYALRESEMVSPFVPLRNHIITAFICCGVVIDMGMLSVCKLL